MKKLLAAALILSLLAAALPGVAEDIDDAWMKREFLARRIVGGTVVISRYGETVYRYAYGSKTGDGTMDPVTPDTCYRVASVTKLVSAIGLMQLYDAGAFRLDDPINDYLPFTVMNTSFPNDPITIRQVLSHTTGVKQTQNVRINWDYVSARSSESLFTRYTRPGGRYVYSNVNGGLIGALIEAISGESVNTYMREHVFAPMKVNAAYHYSLLPDGSNVSNRMSKIGRNLWNPGSVEEFHYEDTCDPAAHLDYTVGNLVIDAEDLNRIGIMLMNGGWLDGVRYLDPETVRLMQSDPREAEGSSVRAETPYGLGIRRYKDRHKNVWYGHQGMKDGLSADLLYLPEKGLVVTVIANGYEAQFLGDLCSIAVRVMDKALETDWDQMNEPADFAWNEDTEEE